jgi:hypothetical protein
VLDYFEAARQAHDAVAEKTYLEQQARLAPQPEIPWEQREQNDAIERFGRKAREWNEQLASFHGRPTETERQGGKKKWGR